MGRLFFGKSARVAPDAAVSDPGKPLKPSEERQQPTGCLGVIHRPRGKGSHSSGAVGKGNTSAVPDANEQTLIFLGCDNAGKSTMIAGLRGKPVEGSVPTVGFDRSKVEFAHGAGGSSTPLRLFDVGGGKGIRGIWSSYFADVHGAAFVVDAADHERFDEASMLLHEAYAHEALMGKPLLVLANKQDLPGSANPAELAAALRLHELSDSCYHIAATSAITGAVDSAKNWSVHDAITWLLLRVSDDFSTLDARCTREQAEQKERERKAKEERKARLAAKRAAREAEEAAEAERAKQKEAQQIEPQPEAGKPVAADAALATTSPAAGARLPKRLEPLPFNPAERA